MAKSRFIRISPFLLVEYIYTDNLSPETITNNFIIVKNKYIEVNQIFNDAGNTNNIQDITSVHLGNNQQAYLDLEKIPNYLDYDNINLEYDEITGFTVPVDSVRFHFVSGYTFDTYKGIILGIRNVENDGKPNIFSNIVVYPQTFNDIITFNSKPIFLTDAIFDKYIEVKIPAIKLINDDYYTALNKSTTFASKITPRHTDSGFKGFIKDANITITLDVIGDISELRTDQTVYDIFKITDHKEAKLTQSDDFDNLNAVIQDSPGGDYIEFFAEYNDQFVEEFISRLNQEEAGNKWIIMHQLSVFEQVGSAFINTAKQMFIQEDDFDEPLVFRPVLKNGDTALSFSIDYLLRLINQKNGEQIIRSASFSSFDVKKWGKNILKIELTDAPQSHKIYNKIIKKEFESSLLFIEPSKTEATLNQTNQVALETTNIQTNGTNTVPEVITQNVFVPLFFNYNNITVSSENMLITEKDENQTIAFGQGNLWIILNPFDNVIKFKVYEKKNNEQISSNLALGTQINIVFIDSNENKLRYSNINDPTKENLSQGEVIFKIPSDDATKILNSNINSFYITSLSKDNSETVIYNGEWYPITEKAIVDEHNRTSLEATQKQVTTEVRIRELEAQVETLTAANLANTATRVTPVSTQLSNNSLLVDIPGYVSSVSLNAAQNDFSITSQLKPSSVILKPTTVEKSLSNLIKPDDDISKTETFTGRTGATLAGQGKG